MNNTLLALVVGLAAGVCGAVVPGLVSGDPAPGGRGGGDVTADLRAVVERLDRIEERLAGMGPVLRGTGSGGDAAATLPALRPDDEALIEAILARYDQRLRDVVGETIDQKWDERGPPAGAASGFEFEIPTKKKVTLAELAQELELSSFEESELRRIHEETMEKALALMATDEDGGIDQVKRDLDAVKEDPSKMMEFTGKYMGRVIQNIGGFMVLDQEHNKKIKELIGGDKATRLENEYEVSDLDPYDIESVLTAGFGD